MIAITITPAAYKVLKAVRPETDEALCAGKDGMIRVWLNRKFVDQLAEMRAKGESYSEVILGLAKTSSSPAWWLTFRRTGQDA